MIANVALSVLDEHFADSQITSGERAKRRRRGLAVYRLARYADDWVLAVSGTREQAEDLRAQAAEVLSTMGLRLSPEKTLITHIDEGLDFLGWRIQRHRKRGTAKHYIYVYPAKKALRAVMAKIKALCWQDTNLPFEVLLRRLNPVVQGWAMHFRYGCSSATFAYVRAYLWQRVFGWLRRKHPKMTWKKLRRRYTRDGWWPASEDAVLFNPAGVSTRRYYYRGTKIPNPWPIGA